MIRIVFTKNIQAFTIDHENKIKSFGLEWQVINTTDTRILIAALVMHVERAEALKRFLTAMGYDPVIIYYINQDGTQTGDIIFAESEYINAMPDIINRDENGNEISRKRPIVFKEVHTFSGWKEIVI